MPGVNPPRVPEGLRDLMKSLTKEVLREKPSNIYEFSAQYFESIVQDKKDFEFKGFEPIASYESIFKNRERNQVPLSMVYAIIPEGLTELIKEFIKAVLRENPKNICEFAVEYFRKLQQNRNIDSCSVQYAAYESYFKSNERYSFTPYVKCTCGRTFGEGMTHGHSYERQIAVISANNTGTTSNEVTAQQNRKHQVFFSENNNSIQSKNIWHISEINNISTAKSLNYENEKYVNAINVLQRFFRRYLIKKQNAKQITTQQIHADVVAAVGVNDDSAQNKHYIMSEETAALVIQRTLRRLFSEKFQKQLTTLKSSAAHKHDNILENLELNDNISEAASYTSASTALMSAGSAAEGSEIGGFINYEEGALQNSSIALKDDDLTNEKINISKEEVNKATEKHDIVINSEEVNAVSSESDLHEKPFSNDIKDSSHKSSTEVDSTKEDTLNNYESKTIINKSNIETSNNLNEISSELNPLHTETFPIPTQSNDERELESMSETISNNDAALTSSIDTNSERNITKSIIKNDERDSLPENVTKRESITEETITPIRIATNEAMPQRNHDDSNADQDAQGETYISSKSGNTKTESPLTTSADGKEIMLLLTNTTNQSLVDGKPLSHEIGLVSETDGKLDENKSGQEKSTSNEIEENPENHETNLTLETIGKANDNASKVNLSNDQTEKVDRKLDISTLTARDPTTSESKTTDNIANETVTISENICTTFDGKADNVSDVTENKPVSLDINEVQISPAAALQIKKTKPADDKLNDNLPGVNISSIDQAESKLKEKLYDTNHELKKREITDSEISENISDIKSVSDEIGNVLGTSERDLDAVPTINDKILSDSKLDNYSSDIKSPLGQKTSLDTNIDEKISNIVEQVSLENKTETDDKPYARVSESFTEEPNDPTSDITPQTGLPDGIPSQSTNDKLSDLDPSVTPLTDHKAISNENVSGKSRKSDQKRSLDLTSNETESKPNDDLSDVISTSEHTRLLDNTQDEDTVDAEPTTDKEKTISVITDSKPNGNPSDEPLTTEPNRSLNNTQDEVAVDSELTTDKETIEIKSGKNMLSVSLSNDEISQHKRADSKQSRESTDTNDDIFKVKPSTESLDQISRNTTVNDNNLAQVLPIDRTNENISDLKPTSDEIEYIPESENKPNGGVVVSSTEHTGSLDNKVDKNTSDVKNPTNSLGLNETKDNISDLKLTQSQSNENSDASDSISSIEQQTVKNVAYIADQEESAEKMSDVNILDKIPSINKKKSSDENGNVLKVVEEANDHSADVISKNVQNESTNDKSDNNNSDSDNKKILNQALDIAPPTEQSLADSLPDLNISSNEQIEARAETEPNEKVSAINHEVKKREVTDSNTYENIFDPDEVGHVHESGVHTLDAAFPTNQEEYSDDKTDDYSADVTTLSNQTPSRDKNISVIRPENEKTADHETTQNVSNSKIGDHIANDLANTDIKTDDNNSDQVPTAYPKQSSQTDKNLLKENSVLDSSILISEANITPDDHLSGITELSDDKTNERISKESFLQMVENTPEENNSSQLDESILDVKPVLNPSIPISESGDHSDVKPLSGITIESTDGKTNEHILEISSLQFAKNTPEGNQALDVKTDNQQDTKAKITQDEISKPEINTDLKANQVLNDKESTLNENNSTKDTSLDAEDAPTHQSSVIAIIESNPIIADKKDSISDKDETNEDLITPLLNKTFTILKSDSISDSMKIATEEETNHQGKLDELSKTKTEVVPKDDNDNNLKTDIGNLSSDSIIGTQNLHDSSNEIESSKKIVSSSVHSTNKKQRDLNKANNKHSKISSEKLIPNPPIAEIYLKSFKLPPDALPWYDNRTTADLNSTYITKVASSEGDVPKVKSEATQCGDKNLTYSQISGDDTEFSTDSLNDNNYTRDSLELTSSKETDIEGDSLEMDPSQKTVEKERMATYLYGVHTPITQARKVYKAPTAFIVPFDDNTSKKSKIIGLKEYVDDDDVTSDGINNNESNLKKEHINTSEESNTKKPALRLNLNKDESIEGAPQIDLETPTKLFAELNDFDYTINDTDTNAEELNYSMDTTYSAEEILRLNSNIMENESMELEDLYISEPAPSSASMLQTIVELNESETPRPDEKMDSTFEPLDASESLSGSENESSWTCSKETDEPILSDEYMNENEIFQSETINRRKISVADNSNETTQGGIYEMSPEKHAKVLILEENILTSPESKSEDILKENETEIVENDPMSKSHEQLGEEETISVKGNLQKSTDSKSEGYHGVHLHQLPINYHTSVIAPPTEHPSTENMSDSNIAPHDKVEPSKPKEKISDANHQIKKREITDSDINENAFDIKLGNDKVDHLSETLETGEHPLDTVPPTDHKPDNSFPDISPISDQKMSLDNSSKSETSIIINPFTKSADLKSELRFDGEKAEVIKDKLLKSGDLKWEENLSEEKTGKNNNLAESVQLKSEKLFDEEDTVTVKDTILNSAGSKANPHHGDEEAIIVQDHFLNSSESKSEENLDGEEIIIVKDSPLKSIDTKSEKYLSNKEKDILQKPSEMKLDENLDVEETVIVNDNVMKSSDSKYKDKNLLNSKENLNEKQTVTVRDKLIEETNEEVKDKGKSKTDVNMHGGGKSMAKILATDTKDNPFENNNKNKHYPDLNIIRIVSDFIDYEKRHNEEEPANVKGNLSTPFEPKMEEHVDAIIVKDNFWVSDQLKSKKLLDEEDTVSVKDTILKSAGSKANPHIGDEEAIIAKEHILDFSESKLEQNLDGEEIIIVKNNSIKSIDSKFEKNLGDEETIVNRENLQKPADLNLKENLDGEVTEIVKDNFLKSPDSKYEEKKLLQSKEYLDKKEIVLERNTPLKSPEAKTEEVKDENKSKNVIKMNDQSKSMANFSTTGTKDIKLQNNERKLDHDINIGKTISDFINNEKRYNKEDPANVKENIFRTSELNPEDHLDTIIVKDNILETAQLKSEKLLGEENTLNANDNKLKSTVLKPNQQHDEKEAIIVTEHFLNSSELKSEEHLNEDKIIVVEDNSLKSLDSETEKNLGDKDIAVNKDNLQKPNELKLQENLHEEETKIVKDTGLQDNNKSKLDRDLNIVKIVSDFINYEKHYCDNEPVNVKENLLNRSELKTEEHFDGEGTIMKDNVPESAESKHEEHRGVFLYQVPVHQHVTHMIPSPEQLSTDNMPDVKIFSSDHGETSEVNTDKKTIDINHQIKNISVADDETNEKSSDIKSKAEEEGHVSGAIENTLNETPPTDSKAENHFSDLTLLSDQKTYQTSEEHNSEKENKIFKNNHINKDEPVIIRIKSKPKEHLDGEKNVIITKNSQISAGSTFEEDFDGEKSVIVKENLPKSAEFKSQQYSDKNKTAIVKNKSSESKNGNILKSDEHLINDKPLKLPKTKSKEITDRHKNKAMDNGEISKESHNTSSAVPEGKSNENSLTSETKNTQLEDNEGTKLNRDAEDNPFQSPNGSIIEELPYSEKTVVVNFKFYPLSSPDLNSEERLNEEGTIISYKNLLESSDSKFDNDETVVMNAQLLEFPESKSEEFVSEDTVSVKKNIFKSTELKPKTENRNEAETVISKKNLLKSSTSKARESSTEEDFAIVNPNLLEPSDMETEKHFNEEAIILNNNLLKSPESKESLVEEVPQDYILKSTESKSEGMVLEKDALTEESNVHDDLNESILEINQRLNDAEKLIEETVTEDTSLGFIEETIADLKDAHIQLSEFEMLISQAPTPPLHEPSEDDEKDNEELNTKRDLSFDIVDSSTFHKNVIIIENAALFIQKTYRGYLTRKQFQKGQHTSPKKAQAHNDKIERNSNYTDASEPNTTGETLHTSSVEPSISKNCIEDISASIIQRAFKKYIDSKHKTAQIQILGGKNNDNSETIVESELNKHGEQSLEVNILKNQQSEINAESAIPKKRVEEMAALIIQRAFKKYIENKSKPTDIKISEDSSWDNSQSTVIYIGNDNNMSKIGEDSKSYASLDIISDLNSENEYPLIIHPEPSAPSVEELGSDHDTENPKVNWFVGNEPIVSTKLSDKEIQPDLLNLLNVPATNTDVPETNTDDADNDIVPDITHRTFGSDILQDNVGDDKKLKDLNVNKKLEEENLIKPRLIMDVDEKIAKESAVHEVKSIENISANETKDEDKSEDGYNVINVIKIVSDFITYEKRYTDSDRNVPITNLAIDSNGVISKDQIFIEANQSTSEAHESSRMPKSTNTNDKNAIAPLIISDNSNPVENVMVAINTNNNDSFEIDKLHSNDSRSFKESNNSVEIVSAVDNDNEGVKEEEIILKNSANNDDENIEKESSHILTTTTSKNLSIDREANTSFESKNIADEEKTGEAEGLQSEVITDSKASTVSKDDKINDNENEPNTNSNESSTENKANDAHSTIGIKDTTNTESKVNTVQIVSDFINHEKRYNDAEKNQSIEILELHEKIQPELLSLSTAPASNTNLHTADVNSSDLLKSDKAPINLSDNNAVAHVALLDSTKNYISEVDGSSKELSNSTKIVSAVENGNGAIEKVEKEVDLKVSTREVEEKGVKVSSNTINTSNNDKKEGQDEDDGSDIKLLHSSEDENKLEGKETAEEEKNTQSMANEIIHASSTAPEDKLIEKLLTKEAKNLDQPMLTHIVNIAKTITDFIDSERRHNDFDKNARNKRSTSDENVGNNEVEDMPIINEFITAEKNNIESEIPYEKLEEVCIKKSVSLTYLADVEKDAASTPAVDDVIVKSETKVDLTEKSNDSSEMEVSFDDTLNSMTGKLRETDEIIEKMQHRRASETRVNSIEEKLVKETSFDEPVIRTMQEELQDRGLSAETEDEELIVNRLQREDTRESSAQSDSVIFGDGENSNVDEQEEEKDFEESAIVKASLKRLYTIAAGEDPKSFFKSVTIDDDIKYIEPSSEIETTATSDSSFCLDDDTSENIRQKMMAYSLSEADSDYFDASNAKLTSSTGISMDKPKLSPNDFNISTALVDAADTSTETESTIVSAATKIQAGARGFLTRKRLRRASAGTKSSIPDESKASFGNDAISESLERLVEDEAAKKIQKAYRKHYREQRVTAHSEGSASAFDHGTPLAARRLTLQRGDAMRNDSTPDEENGSTSNSSSENGKQLMESSNAEQKSMKRDLVSISSMKIEKSTTAATKSDRAKIIMENKLRWLALRQNSMPVQIDDSEVFRVIPKHMRKRIKSAEGDKNIRRRVLKD